MTCKEDAQLRSSCVAYQRSDLSAFVVVDDGGVAVVVPVVGTAETEIEPQRRSGTWIQL